MSQHLSQTKSVHPDPSTKPGNSSVYQSVTNRILAALKEGVVPWRKPWRGQQTLPTNAVSKRAYHGVNLLLLSISPHVDQRWLTIRQANQLGGRVRRGEHGSLIVFWKQLDVTSGKDEAEAKRKTVSLLRYYHVFNVEQCEKLSLPELEVQNEELHLRLEKAEAVIQKMQNRPKIIEGGRAASYLPSEDLVRCPKLNDFESIESYYATLFHELGHATGHESRLNRPGVTGKVCFGSCDYSREELVAELTSAFICAKVGIDNSVIGNAISYIGGWLNALEDDPRAVVGASSQAQRAADYVLRSAT